MSFDYDGFISYSHRGDSHIARALQHGLRRLGRPWYKPSSLRLFRDETDLTASPSLWGDVKKALDAARYLILMASPTAASSVWVRRELAYWVSGGKYEDPDSIEPDQLNQERISHLLIVLSNGEIVWDWERKDFDWSRTDALPSLLSGIFHEAPLWVDLRWAREHSRTELGRKNRQFNEAVAKLLSPIRNKDYLSLLDDEYKAYRRNLRTAVAAASALAVAVVFAVYFGVEAENRAGELQVRLLLAQSREVLNDHRPLAQLLAVEASRRSNDQEARSGLHEVLTGAASAAVIRSGRNLGLSKVFDVDLKSSGLELLQISDQGVHEITIGDEVKHTILLNEKNLVSAVLLKNGRGIVFATRRLDENNDWVSKIKLFDRTSATAPKTILEASGNVKSLVQVLGCDCIGFIHDHTIKSLNLASLEVTDLYKTDTDILSLTAPSNGGALFFVEEGAVYRLELGSIPKVNKLYDHADAEAVVSSRNGHVIASWSGQKGAFSTKALRLDRTNSTPKTLAGSRKPILGITISVDERQVIVLTDTLRVWDFDQDGKSTCDRHGHDGEWDIEPASILQVGSSNVFVSNMHSETRLWYVPCINADGPPMEPLTRSVQESRAPAALNRFLKDIQEPWIIPSKLRGTVTDIRFSPSGRWLAASDDSGGVNVWEYGDKERLILAHDMSSYAAAEHPAGPFQDTGWPTPLAWSPDGRLLAWYDHSYRLLFFTDPLDSKTGRPVSLGGDDWLIEDIRFVHAGNQLALVGDPFGLMLIDVKAPHTRRQISIGENVSFPRVVPGIEPDTVGVLDASSGALQYFRIGKGLERISASRTATKVRLGTDSKVLWGDRGSVWQVPSVDQYFAKVVNFAGNNNALAFASERRVVILNSLGELIDRLESANMQPLAVALDPTGHLLATGFNVGVLRLHNLDPEVLRRRACTMAGRQLDASEWRRYLPYDTYRESCPGLLTLSIKDPPSLH